MEYCTFSIQNVYAYYCSYTPVRVRTPQYEYAPEGQTINAVYYLVILRRLRDAVQRKLPDLWAAKNFQLHHDNVPAHVVQAFPVKNNMPLDRQAPYSTDLAPSGFWLFPKLKVTLKRKQFQFRDGIMKKSTEELQGIAEVEFNKGF